MDEGGFNLENNEEEYNNYLKEKEKKESNHFIKEENEGEKNKTGKDSLNFLVERIFGKDSKAIKYFNEPTSFIQPAIVKILYLLFFLGLIFLIIFTLLGLTIREIFIVGNLRPDRSWQYPILLILGLFLGIILVNCKFGFSSHFRNFLTFSNLHGIRAQMLMISITSLFFGVAFLVDFFFFAGENGTKKNLQSFVSTITISVPIGAFLFGVGMQIADGCSSGTLYCAGKFSLYSLSALPIFILGAVLGVYFKGLRNGVWNIKLFSLNFLYILDWKREDASAFHIIACIIIIILQCSFFFALYIFIGQLEKIIRKDHEEIKEKEKKDKENEEYQKIEKSFEHKEIQEENDDSGIIMDDINEDNNENEENEKEIEKAFIKENEKPVKNKLVKKLKVCLQKLKEKDPKILVSDILKYIYDSMKIVICGPWSLEFGAIAISFINIILLIISLKPWSVVDGLLKIGIKFLYSVLGIDSIQQWPAFKHTDLNKMDLFFVRHFHTNIGIILGAALASTIAGTFPIFIINQMKKNKKKENIENDDLNPIKINTKKDELKPLLQNNNKNNNENNFMKYDSDEIKKIEEEEKDTPEMLVFKIFVKLTGHVIGALLLGIGAIFATGCNIGGYYSAIASFSLHGYVWILFALLGNLFGIFLRPLFFLKSPKIPFIHK